MLERVKVRLARVGDEERCERLLKGAAWPVEERLYYVAISPHGGLLAVIPNLGSRLLRLTTGRLPNDRQQRYGHPLCLVETFVDPEQFQGTVYKFAGRIELGQTSGYRRCHHDYCVRHGRPKRKWTTLPNFYTAMEVEGHRPSMRLVTAKRPPSRIAPYE